MNTGGFASNMELLDWMAGQALVAIPHIGRGSDLESEQIAHDAYNFASAMLAEKARREADHSEDTLGKVTHREVDNDYWAKFQDGIIITFEPRNGWCASIREGSMGSGQTIASAIANLRAQWEEKNVVPDHFPDATKMVALESANKELVEALKALLARDQRNTCQHEETHRGGHIWEICDQCGAKWADDEGGKPAWEDPSEWVKAEAILAKHKATK